MPSNGLPFEFDPNGKGSNTRLDYAFRDGDVVVRESVVLEGRLSTEDVNGIASGLPEGAKFLPRKLALPDLLTKMPSNWVETAESYHEIERISFTPRAEDGFVPSAEQFAGMAESHDEPLSNWGYDAAPTA